jgi:hypothetical protein
MAALRGGYGEAASRPGHPAGGLLMLLGRGQETLALEVDSKARLVDADQAADVQVT